MWSDPKALSLTRFVMYDSLRNSWRRLGLDGDGLSVLSVSGSEGLCSILDFRAEEQQSASYPEVNITALPFPSGSFDAVVSDQVLEHVGPDPTMALAETARVLKPLGRAVHTTCLLNPVHPSPEDYWRFTPSGLEAMCVRSGLRVLEASGWGNRVALIALVAGLRRAPVGRLPERLRGRLLRNDWRWPIVTWLVAERDSTEV